MTRQSDTWYERIVNRTTAGEVTFDATTADESDVWTVVWNTDSSLDADEGVLIGGTSNTGSQLYDECELS